MNKNHVLSVDDIQNSEGVVIDIRCPEEIEIFGRIPGSYNIPLYVLEDDGEETRENEQFALDVVRLLERSGSVKRAFIICASGQRSLDAQALLISNDELKQVEVINCVGGMDDWIAKGNPVTEQ